jgi:hypothetical protein
MSRKFCNGFIPSPPDAAPYGLAYAPVESPPSCDALSKCVRRGGEQLAEDCLAWAYAGAIWATLGLLGLPRTWPSVLALYYLARLKRAKGKKALLTDTGSNMLAMSEVARETGWVSETRWRYDRSNVNKEPPWDALTAGLDQDWLRPRRILHSTKLVAQIKSALSAPGKQARFVVRGKRVDRSYLHWTPGKLAWELTGPVEGRHAELCATYTEDGLGHVSSWGEPYDRIEAWKNIENDLEAETWVADVDVAALVANLRKMGVMR